MSNLDLSNISDNLYMLLLSLNRHIFNPHNLIREFNVPPSHIKVLFYLVHNGPSSISKMAKDLCISKPNMTPVIDKLVENGYVTRDCDPKDRRVIRVEVTTDGVAFLKKGDKYLKSLIKEKLSTLNDDDISTLSTSVDNLSTIIRKF